MIWMQLYLKIFDTVISFRYVSEQKKTASDGQRKPAQRQLILPKKLQLPHPAVAKIPLRIHDPDYDPDHQNLTTCHISHPFKKIRQIRRQFFLGILLTDKHSKAET